MNIFRLEKKSFVDQIFLNNYYCYRKQWLFKHFKCVFLLKKKVININLLFKRLMQLEELQQMPDNLHQREVTGLQRVEIAVSDVPEQTAASSHPLPLSAYLVVNHL